MIKNRRIKKRNAIITDINIVPYVDVLLILLIVFIVSSPIPSPNHSVDIIVPKVSYSKEKTGASNIITITQDGVFLNGKILDLKTKHRFGFATVSVRADRNLPYDKVAKAISFLKGNGVKTINLIVGEK